MRRVVERFAIAAALVSALVLAACKRGGESASDAGAAEPPWDGLTLDLTPDPERGDIEVGVVLAGASARVVSELAVARAWADTRAVDTIGDVRVRDAEGDLPFTPRQAEGEDLVLTLVHPPRGGELVVRYHARANVGRSRFALHVADDRVSGVGHAFLLLPRVDDPVRARIRFHVGRLRRGADAASSFGFGTEVVTNATSEDLAHAAYAAGLLWRETSPTAQGATESPRSLLVLGNPPFDTRMAFDHALAVEAAVDRFFGEPPPSTPFTFFLVAQPALGSAHDGASLTRSLGVWFDARQPLDAELDLVIAHELVHRFLGGAVRLVGAGGREATWFSEGFTVHFARRALLDAGLVRPADFAADVNRTLAMGSPGEERLPSEYRRGATQAALMDIAIRHASHDKRSLDDVIRDLVASARRAGSARLPVDTLRDALGHELGAAGAASIDHLEAGEDPPVDLPADTFGPCIRRTVTERRAFELGFDRKSLEARPAFVRGLAKGSAADRAGVREGALVVSSRVPAESDALGKKRARVELLFADGKRARYRPIGMKRDVHWEAAPCVSPHPATPSSP